MSFDYLDHYTMKQNRLKVLKESKYKCALCGAKATEIHHKDGSKSNHKTDNMLPLCHKCHMKLHKQERKNTKPKVDSIAIEHLLMLRGMSKQELAEKLGMSIAAVSTILKRQTTKNTTLKKIADVLCCDIESIVIKPNNPVDLVLCQEKVQIKMSKLFPSISVRIKL
jgi:DNA-binding Xre family transcriptional regulator